MVALWKQMCVLCLLLPTVSLAQTDEKPSLPTAAPSNLVFSNNSAALRKLGIILYVSSPDGTKIAYLINSIGTPGSPSMMRVRNTDGTDDEWVKTEFEFVQPYPDDFSKDNQFLLISGVRWADLSSATDFSIWRVQLSTGACKRLTPPFLSCANALFSPSEKNIVFQSHVVRDKPLAPPDAKTARPSKPNPHQDFLASQEWVSVVSSAGTNLKRLHPGFFPRWSPDGAHISYFKLTPDGARTQLYIMDRLGKRVRQMQWRDGALKEKYDAKFSVSSYTWLDRRTLVVTGSSKTSGLPAGQLQTWVVSSDGTVKAKRPENGLRDSK